jgi:spore germination cell wall hydrolase CwlJ-like protein
MSLAPEITPDTLLLAALIAGEARGEPVEGQHAVAWVVRNRVEIPRWWGHTYREVMLKPWQFSTFNPVGDEWEAREVVLNRLDVATHAHVHIAGIVMAGLTRDPTHGATHYHATYVSPAWADELVETAHIGAHIFYRGPT